MEGDLGRGWKDHPSSSWTETRKQMEDEEVKVRDGSKGRKRKPTQGRKEMAQHEAPAKGRAASGRPVTACEREHK